MRPWTHASVLVSAPIILQKQAVIAAAICILGITRLRHAISAFAVCRSMPGGEGNQSLAVGARPFKRAFVLLRAVDVIRKLVVDIHVVKLAGGLIVLGAPSLTAIRRYGGAAVVAFEQDLGVVRVDPHYVIVAMRCAQFGECFAAIMRNPQRIHLWRVHGVW